jgi:nucleotide-binding universal stress UspA family protein
MPGFRMSYKTILVHADLSVHAPARIRLAAAVANAEGAHLIGAAMTGLSRFVYPNSPIDIERAVVPGFIDTLHENARKALDLFAEVAGLAGVRSCEKRLVGADAEGGLVLLARFSDLLVLSQTDPAQPAPGVARDLPEYVILNVARPVLLVPYAAQFDRLDGKALVAWDASLEATRALGYALPLLRRAAGVTLAQFDQPDWADLAAESPDLIAWLGRHGVVAQVQAQHTSIDDGKALLALAAAQQPNLIVMGGYGHTRLRELLLGGVTKTVLESATVPVLMSH